MFVRELMLYTTAGKLVVVAVIAKCMGGIEGMFDRGCAGGGDGRKTWRGNERSIDVVVLVAVKERCGCWDVMNERQVL